ncbi:hypothetical protein [Streptomyces sp. SID12488]|uniref:hypothetical protein n=1 Tax=Streptomyces sp. SID12488 TaxID=2706040 RepID=UPI0013DBE280|nr:hypothetical protein [Streptomyces sp. SID12488]NEA63637.1 hypothetical protein [Streptomyces sp. SID12488]
MYRKIRRRTTPVRALVALTLALGVAGCADRTDSGKEGGNNVSSAPSPTPTSTTNPTSPTPSSAGCKAVTTLGARDSGLTVCLAVGDTVRVSLDGTSERPWKPVTLSGPGLAATNSGVVLLPGDASAAFKAVSAGRTRLESTRPLCAARTGQVSCRGIQEWGVTVVVK